MPMPSGLKFTDRIAYDKATKTYWFQCQKGHKRRLARATRSDIDDARSQHDRDYHRGENATTADARRATLAEALAEVISYTESLVDLGKRDRKTLVEMRRQSKWLTDRFGSRRLLASLDVTAVRQYAVWRISTTSSKGAAAVGELKLIQRMARDRGISLGWNLKDLIEEIDPVHRRKVHLPPDMLIEFVTAYGTDGLFFDVTFTKLRTILRNVELISVLVQDVNLSDQPLTAPDGHVIPPRSIRYVKRYKAKRSHVWSFVPIPDDLRPILLRRMRDKQGSDLLFTQENGSPVHSTTLRWATERAWESVSKKWGFSPGNKGFAQLRGQVTTSVLLALDTEAASRLAGHYDTRVTEKFYNYDREAIEPKRRGSDAAASLYSLEKLRGSGNPTAAGQEV